MAGQRKSKRRIGLIMLLFIGSFLGSFVLTLPIASLIPESYTSTATISVSKKGQADPVANEVLEVEMERLKSTPFLQEVVDELKLTNVWSKRWNLERLNATEAVGILRLGLLVKGGTKLIRISYASEDKKEAADVANAIARRYQTEAATNVTWPAVEMIEPALPRNRPDQSVAGMALRGSFCCAFVLTTLVVSAIWGLNTIASRRRRKAPPVLSDLPSAAR